MARGPEMCIPWFEWIHASDDRLQEFRIRFPITDSHLGETFCQQGRKRMISRQMLFDSRLVRDEDHKKFRMACFDRLLQLFQDSESQFNAVTISFGHHDVGFEGVLPLKCFDQCVDAIVRKIINTGFPSQGTTESSNYSVSNMIAVQG